MTKVAGRPFLLFLTVVPLCVQLLASASYDNNICVYKEEDDDWECCATLKGHTSTVWSLSFDAAGQRLASCSDDCTVKIWKEHSSQSAQGDGWQTLQYLSMVEVLASFLSFDLLTFVSLLDRLVLEMRLHPVWVSRADSLRR